MPQLINLFLDICLFRKGPQDVPASLWLMYATLAASLAISLLANWLIWAPGQPFGTFLLTLALLLWIVVGLLSWRQKMPRLKQTFTALFGTDGLLTLINLPFMVYALPQGGQQASGIDLFVAFTQLGLMAWSLLVIAHILRHALEMSLQITSIVAISWFAGAIMIHSLVSGSATG